MNICYWKLKKNHIGEFKYETTCDRKLYAYGFMFQYNFCPYCGGIIELKNLRAEEESNNA